MAANRIAGLSIEIDGETTKLNKALSDTQKEIKNTKDELKDVERLLKYDPKNVELLEQKQRLLTTAVGETKSKLDQLKDAEKQVQDQVLKGKTSQDEYDKLRREIIETEQSLKDLESQAASSADTISNRVGNALDTISSKSGDVAKKFAPVTAAIAAGTGVALNSAMDTADELVRLRDETGLSVEQLQKYGYVGGQVGVDLETIAGSQAKLTKAMNAARDGTGEQADAFAALGISVTDSNGELKNSQDVFRDTISALDGVANETERDALAMQIFGRSAMDLNPIIALGGDGLAEMEQQAADLGTIMSDDTVTSLDDAGDSMDVLKTTLITTIAEGLSPIIEKVTDVIKWFTGLDEGTKNTIGIIALLIAAISPVAGIISAVTGAISGITAILPAATAATGAMGAATSTTMIPIIAIAAAIAAVIAIIVLLVKNWDWVKDSAVKIWEGIKDTFKSVIDWIVQAFKDFIKFITDTWDKIKKVFSTVMDWIKGAFSRDWTESLGALGNFLNGFFQNVQNIWESIKRIFSGVIEFIKGVFSGDWQRAWEGIKNIFGGIFDGLVALVKAPVNAIIALLNTAIDGVNFLIRGFNKIGGKLGITIGEIGHIGYLAKGGILSSGSAIVGENGPELLSIVSGGRAQVTPLTGSAANNALSSAGMGGMGGFTLNIENFVNNDTDRDINSLADFVAERIYFKTAQKGRAMGMI